MNGGWINIGSRMPGGTLPWMFKFGPFGFKT